MSAGASKGRSRPIGTLGASCERAGRARIEGLRRGGAAMVASHVLRVLVFALFVAPAVAIGAQRTAPVPFDPDYVVVPRFLPAADEYVVQHHRLFEPLSEEFMCLPEDTI